MGLSREASIASTGYAIVKKPKARPDSRRSQFQMLSTVRHNLAIANYRALWQQAAN